MRQYTKRTTLPIADLLWTVNHFLKHSAPEAVVERKANADLITICLHATGTYCGFQYINVEFPRAGLPVVHDETRRQYIVDPALNYDYELATDYWLAQ